MIENEIEATIRAWDQIEKTPLIRTALWFYDSSSEPRPGGRYLLLTWDGKKEERRFYRTKFGRSLAYLAYWFRKRV